MPRERVCLPGGICPGWCLPTGWVSAQGCLCQGGVSARVGVCLRGGCLPRGCLCQGGVSARVGVCPMGVCPGGGVSAQEWGCTSPPCGQNC